MQHTTVIWKKKHKDRTGHCRCRNHDTVTIIRNFTSNARELTEHSSPKYQLPTEPGAMRQTGRGRESNGCNDKVRVSRQTLIGKRLPASAADIDEPQRWQSIAQSCPPSSRLPNNSGPEIEMHLLFQSHLNILTYLNLSVILREILCLEMEGSPILKVMKRA